MTPDDISSQDDDCSDGHKSLHASFGNIHKRVSSGGLDDSKLFVSEFAGDQDSVHITGITPKKFSVNNRGSAEDSCEIDAAKRSASVKVVYGKQQQVSKSHDFTSRAMTLDENKERLLS